MTSPSQKPLLILGGGLIGLSLAHELASKGKQIEVLSKQRNEAAGFVAAGMLAPHAEGLQGELLELGQCSLRRIPSWVEFIESTSGINCGLRNCGVVVPFYNDEARTSYPTAEFGKPLSHNDLKKEVPGIANHWQTGLLFEQDGQIDNRRRLMRALERSCVALGVQFQEGIEVLKIIHNENYFQGVTIRSANGHIENIIANEAIICSGAWSKRLFNDLPIFPVKGQMLSIQGPKDALKRVIFGPGTYLVPREDGLIIVGATSEKEAGFNTGLTPFGQQELELGMNNLIPTANGWPPMERWCGFRPCTPDKMPILGESKLKGLWLATGHYRNGVLLAAITADLMTKCICKQTLKTKEKTLLSCFKIDRFKNV